MTISFEVGTHKYQARRMDTFDQMIVAKRLMPVLKHIVTPDVLRAAIAAAPAKDAAQPVTPTLDMPGAETLLPAIADALYGLADDDLKIITRKCLSLVDRQNAGGAYSPLLASTGGFLFDDVGMPEALQICWKVIGAHFGDFLATAR